MHCTTEVLPVTVSTIYYLNITRIYSLKYSFNPLERKSCSCYGYSNQIEKPNRIKPESNRFINNSVSNAINDFNLEGYFSSIRLTGSDQTNFNFKKILTQPKSPKNPTKISSQTRRVHRPSFVSAALPPRPLFDLALRHESYFFVILVR